MIALLRQCVRFRELVLSLARRELNSRYRGSMLGKIWLVLQPLAFLAIYYVVFSQLFGRRMPGESASTFALAWFCGLVPWIGHAETVQRGTGCVVEHSNLIKKFAFPTEILPVYMTLVSLFNSLVGFGMLAIAVWFFQDGQLPRMIWLLPIAMVLQGMFTMGLVYMLSSVAVYIRDIAQMIPMVMIFWFFMSPIFMFAKSSTTPALLQTVLKYNPMTYLISIYREIFIWTPDQLERLRTQQQASMDQAEPFLENVGLTPEQLEKLSQLRAAEAPVSDPSIALPMTQPGDVPWFELGVFAACAFAFLFLGLKVFQKLKPGFPDEI